MPRTDAARQQRLKIRLALVLGTLGAVIFGSVLVLGSLPEPLWLLALLAAAEVYVEWSAAEVNEALRVSTAPLVLMTAAVIFADSGPVVALAVMAALSAVQARDIRERQWFQPVVNFGQFMVTAVVAALIFTSLAPAMVPDVTAVPRLVLAAVVATVTSSATNLALVQVISRIAFGRAQVRAWSHTATIMLPYLGTGVLAALLGTMYHLIGLIALAPISVVFFMSQSTFVSYGQLRNAQESTLRGFVKALEAKDLYTRGHTERVARFSEMVGSQMGFRGARLEKLRWAALIHDVGKLAVPRDLIRKRTRLTDVETEQMEAHVHLVEEVLSEVEFLQPMVDIAAHHHTHYDGGGYHGGRASGSQPSIEARILAVADAFDAMTSSRSYRLALSQQYAFTELRDNAGTQFDPEVVEALVAALEASGECYGSAEVNNEEEARRMAEAEVLDV